MPLLLHGAQHHIKQQELLRKEKEIERRERRAERDERIYLAEERQEQIILKQKEEAKEKEEKKFIAVEKEYESVAELAKEEEVELRYAHILYSPYALLSLFIHAEFVNLPNHQLKQFIEEIVDAKEVRRGQTDVLL